MLLLKDTDAHPDVIAQRKLIESLRSGAARGGGRQPAGKDAAAGRDAAAGGVKHSVPNPVYDQLKVKLIEAGSTRWSRCSGSGTRRCAYRDRLEKVQREQPGLIAEYQNMDRDYTVLRRNYEELLGRLQSANIAQAADTQADKVKLQVIDPPEVPRLPVAPNRLLLVSVRAGGRDAAGIGMTVLFGQLDRSFSTVDDLRALGLPVLGGISILGLVPLRLRLMAVMRFGAAVAVLVCIYGGLMVHILRSAALI